MNKSVKLSKPTALQLGKAFSGMLEAASRRSSPAFATGSLLPEPKRVTVEDVEDRFFNFAKTVTYSERLDVLRFMEMSGGSFVSTLAVAWLHADARNSERMLKAFADIFLRYRALMLEMQAKEGLPL